MFGLGVETESFQANTLPNYSFGVYKLKTLSSSGMIFLEHERMIIYNFTLPKQKKN